MSLHTDALSSYNASETFITLGRFALSAQEFVERAKRYRLTYEQQAIVERVKLHAWNEAMKGEK